MITRAWMSPDRKEIAWEDDDGIVTVYDTIEQRDNVAFEVDRSWTELVLPDNR